MKYICTVHQKAGLCLLCCCWYIPCSQSPPRVNDDALDPNAKTHRLTSQPTPWVLFFPADPRAAMGLYNEDKHQLVEESTPWLKSPLSKSSTSPNSLQLHNHCSHNISSIQQQGSQKSLLPWLVPSFIGVLISDTCHFMHN